MQLDLLLEFSNIAHDRELTHRGSLYHLLLNRIVDFAWKLLHYCSAMISTLGILLLSVETQTTQIYLFLGPLQYPLPILRRNLTLPGFGLPGILPLGSTWLPLRFDRFPCSLGHSYWRCYCCWSSRGFVIIDFGIFLLDAASGIGSVNFFHVIRFEGGDMSLLLRTKRASVTATNDIANHVLPSVRSVRRQLWRSSTGYHI